MDTATHDVPVGAGLTREQAQAIFAQGEEAVVFALLEMAKRLWDLTADAPASSSLTLRGHEDHVTSVAFSPNDRCLITRSGFVAFSSDGHWLVTDNVNKSARLWNLIADDPASSVLVLRHEPGSVSDVIMLPLALEVLTPIRGDKTPRLSDLTADDPASSTVLLRGHEDQVTSVKLSPDGDWQQGHRNSRAHTLHYAGIALVSLHGLLV